MTVATTSTLTKQKIDTSTDDNDLSFRHAPYNILAEQAILGSIMVNNETLNRVGDFLKAEHFYEPVHQRIFAAMLRLIERGLTATPISMKNMFDQDEGLKTLGGAEYLAKLTGIMASIINVESYARIVYDLFVRRKLIEIGNDIVNQAYDEKDDASSAIQIEHAEQTLYNLASEGGIERSFQPLKDSLKVALEKAELAYKREGDISGISCGLLDLDAKLGGLQDSDLLILAGRPSMGKTALAINMALNAVQNLHAEYHNKKVESDRETPPSVGFFSLEMSAEQLAGRMISMISGINASKLRTGNLTDEEFGALVKANTELYELPFFIDDTPAITISALRTRARRLKRKNNLSLLIVDYLQLVRGSSKGGEANRVQEVSEITQGLKAIAKELDIPVIALSQLSRAVEAREDKKPQLSDLRESGSIEQDADIVMFIYREEYYLSRQQPSPDDEKKYQEWLQKAEKSKAKATVIVAKQRHGPIGDAILHFDANTTKFANYTDRDFDDNIYYNKGA